MKILQINKYFYLKGGAETVFFNTIRLLEQHGHTVIPFCLDSPANRHSPYAPYFVHYPELLEASVCDKIRHIPSFVYNCEAARQLDRLLQREKPDVAHIHLLFNSLSVSILPVLRKHGVPVVMTAHDYRLICPAYLFTDGRGRVCERCRTGHYLHCTLQRCSKGRLANSLMLTADSYFRKYVLSPLDYVDRFLFVSHFACAKHIEFSARYAGKSSVLHNFTPLASRQTAAVEKGDYLLFCGRISDEKGIPTLLRAMATFPDIKLKVAGTGPLLDDMKRQSPPNVEFIGFQSGEALYDCIRRARYVVVPSEWYENNPLSVIEAMTLGTPVIGSRIGGIPELIDEGVTGFLFEAASVPALCEAMANALRLPAEAYGAMCQASRLFAQEHFGEEKYYPRLLSIYHDIINHYNI
jgi:glycosyltransferase involved in cell wall biosynthesis